MNGFSRSKEDGKAIQEKKVTDVLPCWYPDHRISHHSSGSALVGHLYIGAAAWFQLILTKVDPFPGSLPFHTDIFLSDDNFFFSRTVRHMYSSGSCCVRC